VRRRTRRKPCAFDKKQYRAWASSHLQSVTVAATKPWCLFTDKLSRVSPFAGHRRPMALDTARHVASLAAGPWASLC
jgi:hypothetical protein